MYFWTRAKVLLGICEEIVRTGAGEDRSGILSSR